MKYQLSPNTIKKYSTDQLVRHIKTIQDKFDLKLYKIEAYVIDDGNEQLALGSIYRLMFGKYVFRGALTKKNLVDELSLLYQTIEQMDLS